MTCHAHIPTPEPPYTPQPGEPPPTPPVNPRPIDDPKPPKQVPPISDPPPDEKPNPRRYSIWVRPSPRVSPTGRTARP